MKKRQLISAVALALGLAAFSAQAAIFDADGTGGANGAVNIGAFDWGPTSILSQGANTAIGAFATGACSVVNTACQFNLFTHATLVGLVDANGNPLANPVGLNSTFEITMIAMFREVVTGVSTLPNGNTIATFATVPTVPGFLQMFYDNTPDSVALTGRGYNDGRLILNGNTVGNSSSFFTVTSTTPVNLDQSGANDYTGQFTVTGTGSSTNIPVDTLTTDPTFFISPLTTFGVQFANISIGLPFVSVDPSDCFTIAPQAPVIGVTTPLPTGCSAVHVNGTYLANTGELPPGYVPVTGSINGFSPIPPTGGPDFVAQTDFNSPLSSVPEPTSLALFGLGLGLAGFFGSLRRRLFS
jgi:hypothetical protein